MDFLGKCALLTRFFAQNTSLIFCGDASKPLNCNNKLITVFGFSLRLRRFGKPFPPKTRTQKSTSDYFRFLFELTICFFELLLSTPKTRTQRSANRLLFESFFINGVLMNLESFYQRVIAPPHPWRVSKVVIAEDNSRVDVWLEHLSFQFLCHECQQPAPIYDHAPEREWRHLDTCDCPTYLHARIPRVSCPKHGVVNGVFHMADPNVSLTHKMEAKCIVAMQQCDIKGASNIMDVSWDILGYVQKRAVIRGMERRGEKIPKKMGIDEKQVFSRHRYFTIVTDLDEGRVHDVMDQRKISSISPWFEERKSLLDRVEMVAMDMSAGYERIVHDYMEKATVCFDRFHIMQVVQKGVDETRKNEQRSMGDEDKKMMFGARFDFLYGKENLPEKNVARFEQARKIATKTARAWAIKENLRDMWPNVQGDSEKARVYFNKWFWWATHSRIPFMQKAAHTLKDHCEGIFTALQHGISNALTEGINNKIESIKRDACGFRNKESFRTAILFHCSKLDMMPRMS